MPKLDISELVDRFPDFRVTLIVAEGVTIPPERSAQLDAEIAEAELACRARVAAALARKTLAAA